MDHDEARERIYACRDPELPDAERRALQAHLEACSDCRGALRRWERIAGGLFRAAPAADAEAFVRRVMARLEPEPALPWLAAWRLAAWRLPALGLGFAALVFALAVGRGETVSTGDLLLADGHESPPAELTLGPKSAETDELLGFVLEAP